MLTTDHSNSTVVELARKSRSEMPRLSSDSHDPILRDRVEAVKHFSWDTVWLEYGKMIPILILFFGELNPKPKVKKKMLCGITTTEVQTEWV